MYRRIIAFNLKGGKRWKAKKRKHNCSWTHMTVARLTRFARLACWRELSLVPLWHYWLCRPCTCRGIQDNKLSCWRTRILRLTTLTMLSTLWLKDRRCCCCSTRCCCCRLSCRDLIISVLFLNAPPDNLNAFFILLIYICLLFSLLRLHLLLLLLLRKFPSDQIKRKWHDLLLNDLSTLPRTNYRSTPNRPAKGRMKAKRKR